MISQEILESLAEALECQIAQTLIDNVDIQWPRAKIGLPSRSRVDGLEPWTEY